MNKDTRLNKFMNGILFSLFWVTIINVFTPAIVDGLFSGLLLIALPSLILYYIVILIAKALKADTSGFAILLLTILTIPPVMVITSYNILFSVSILVAGGVLYFSYSRWRISAGLSILLLLLTIIQVNSRRGIDEKPKMLVFGADAMKMTIVDSLISQGELPVISKLIDEGASGLLRSQKPLLSPIIWTTIASGYGKDVHGVSNFYSKSSQVSVPRIWHMMEQNGWDAGVFRWLITWPPEKLGGFCVPDIIARDDSSYPDGYGKLNTLRDLLRTGNSPSIIEVSQTVWTLVERGIRGSTIRALAVEGLRLNTRLKDGNFKYRFFRHADMELSVDLFLNLLRKKQPEFAVFYDNAIDLTGHRYWHYHAPEYFDVEAEKVELYGNFVTDMYRYTDSILGRVVDALEGETKLMVVSDHGMQPVQQTGNRWYWVNSEKLLADLKIDDRIFTQLVANKQLVYPVFEADSSSYLDILRDNFERIKTSDGRVFYDLKLNEIGEWYICPLDFDWNELLYLDDQPVNPDRFREYISLFGTHSLFGSVIMTGENIKPGSQVEDAGIFDVAPTLLYWAGMPVADSMEGQVLSEAFIDPVKVEYRGPYELPAYLDSLSDQDMEVDETTKDKLRSMGYVK